MHEWIALDGVKSTTIPGLAVLAYTPPLLAPRSREETVIAGRLTALTQRDWQREPANLEITLALVGESMQAMLALWQAQALPWLYDATRLELDAMQGYFFRGAVTEVSYILTHTPRSESLAARMLAAFSVCPYTLA